MYQINGTPFTTQPESGQWQARKILSLDGNGHPVYPPSREFVIQWSYLSAADLDQIIGFFSACGVTGSAVVTLPQWNKDPYTYFDYTGCIVQEPVIGAYDFFYATQVKLTITNIRT